MVSFLESSAVVALQYKGYINDLIYKSNSRINNPFWMRAWDNFFNDSVEAKNFQIFLGTVTGQKWLKSTMGQMYQEWQKN